MVNRFVQFTTGLSPIHPDRMKVLFRLPEKHLPSSEEHRSLTCFLGLDRPFQGHRRGNHASRTERQPIAQPHAYIPGVRIAQHNISFAITVQITDVCNGDLDGESTNAKEMLGKVH